MPEPIDVMDPIYHTEVPVYRGDQSLYLVYYGDSDAATVLNEDGDPTEHTWVGDINGIEDFHSLHDLFDDLYGKDTNA